MLQSDGWPRSVRKIASSCRVDAGPGQIVRFTRCSLSQGLEPDQELVITEVTDQGADLFRAPAQGRVVRPLAAHMQEQQRRMPPAGGWTWRVTSSPSPRSASAAASSALAISTSVMSSCSPKRTLIRTPAIRATRTRSAREGVRKPGASSSSRRLASASAALVRNAGSGR